MRAVACLVVLAVAVSAFTGPNSYPLFKQCDPAWVRRLRRFLCSHASHWFWLGLWQGPNQMGTPGQGERSNVCGEGCAMSSLSMSLNGLGIQIGGESSLCDCKCFSPTCNG
jgi:hypothetical protein